MDTDQTGYTACAEWSGDVTQFLAERCEQLPGRQSAMTCLQRTLADAPSHGWHIVLGYNLLRVRRRIGVIIVTGAAIVVCRVRESGPGSAADRLAVEDAALDLADFHAGSANLPILPIVISEARVRRAATASLPLPGVAAPIETSWDGLAAVLGELAAHQPTPAHQPPSAWASSPYRPVPTLIDAACSLYARHDSVPLRTARADCGRLARTAEAIGRAVARARAQSRPTVVFVTGAPGAGKTLCGLNAAFGTPDGAFLTGNPTLVHVLREALARDAIGRGVDARAARQRLEGIIQALPGFRDHYASRPDLPPERVVVVDEAQRCWSRAHAIAKTRDRTVTLTDSEPAHVLDAMARRRDGPVLICLLGGGQEIHAGEGGLAEWGAALQSRPGWRVLAPPDALVAPDPRQRLPKLTNLELETALHLSVPIRSIHSAESSGWVDAVLSGDAARARDIAAQAGRLPYQVTRDLDSLRTGLQAACRGTRRAGLVASAEARRLRAEGLGSVLPHQEEDAVARWFLDRWPDVRASDALETVATEFSVQGLEMDAVGVCWDGDLVRPLHEVPWVVRHFRGTAWTLPRRPETIANRLNAYRVLLTRARYVTIIWVPRGDARDQTRDPGTMDRVAAFLLACGAQDLDNAPRQRPLPKTEAAVHQCAML